MNDIADSSPSAPPIAASLPIGCVEAETDLRPQWPDFIQRAEAIWGAKPDGLPLSALVEADR